MTIQNLRILRSILAHSEYLLSLFDGVWRDVNLLASTTRSFAYAMELSLVSEVLNACMLLPLCNPLSVIKRYGLRISPCMVPLWMGMGCVLPKCYLIIMVVDWEYILPIIAMASWR